MASGSETVLAALFVTFALCWSAHAEVLVSRYNVNLSGLRIGEVILHTTLEAKRYKVAVAADVGVLLMNTKVQAEASGSRAGAKLIPEQFQIVMSGAESGTVGVNFAGLTAAGEKTPLRLRGVLDPLTALLLTSLKPSSSSQHPCHNVLKIFTGRARFDLSLSPKATSEAQRESAMITCHAHYAALPDDRQTGREGSEAEENLDLEIGFVRLSKPHFWLPERLSFPSPKGTVTLDRAETSISGT